MTKCIKANVAAMALLAGPITGSGIRNYVFSKTIKLNVYQTNNTMYMVWPLNNADGTVEIYNLEGRLLHRRYVTGNQNSNIKINCADLANGVYHIKATSGTKTVSNKFAITR